VQSWQRTLRLVNSVPLSAWIAAGVPRRSRSYFRTGTTRRPGSDVFTSILNASRG